VDERGKAGSSAGVVGIFKQGVGLYIIMDIYMLIHIFINQTNFVPYRTLYAVEFYVILDAIFIGYFILSGIVFDFWLYFDFTFDFWF